MSKARELLFGDASNSEIKRQIKQKAVRIDGVTIKSIHDTLTKKSSFIVQNGKRKAVKVAVEHTITIRELLGFDIDKKQIRDVSDEVIKR